MDIDTSLSSFITYTEGLWSDKTMGTYAAAVVDLKKLFSELNIQTNGPTSLLTSEAFIQLPNMILGLRPQTRTAKNYIGVTWAYLTYLIMMDYIDLSASEIKRIEQAFKNARRRKVKVIPRDPEIEDADKIIAAVRQLDYTGKDGDIIRDRNLSICHFLRSSGCRVSEINELACGDIDMARRKVGVMGKGSIPRKAYFDQATADALVWYWQARGYRGRNDPAWTRHDRNASTENKPITTNAIRDFIKDAAEIADIYFTPHYFRHVFGKRVLRDTGNLALVQDLMGHKSPVSTRVYATLNDEDLQAAHREIFK